MTHCCRMLVRLLTSQYSTRPTGKNRNRPVRKIGMMFIILACVGSIVADWPDMRCCTHMLMPYSTGKT